MKILFVCGEPPHFLHESFAKAIGADFFYAGSGGWKSILSNIKIIPDGYDIYFTEGLFTYVTLARRLGFINKSSKVINIFSDPRLYQLTSCEKFDFKSNSVKRYPFLKKMLLKYFISQVDGGICVGKFEQGLLRSVAPKMPSRYVEPYINNAFFNLELPDYNNNNILFIGGGPDFNYKGLDFLIDIFSDVNKRLESKSKLYVVGGGWDNFRMNENIPRDVIFLGNKKPKEIVKLSKDCSLYCHFGRGEAYGLVVVEAMAMGLYPVVSDLTGAKEAVKAVNLKDYSFEARREIVDSICDYFEKSKNQKIKIGKTCREYAQKFNKSYSLASFKSNFSSLVEETLRNEKP